MQRPGFWDDSEQAARTSAAHAAAQRRLQTFRSLESDLADLEELSELAADDAQIAGELDAQLRSLEQRLGTLEEARLFSGRYDAGDAVVTVRSGAGGTDSQDWAEMLLRMYLRWAERRGFKVEMKEASPGEEAGLKSATFIARGENAYGLFAAERGVHRLVRLSPFDAAHRRHTSFAEVDVGPLVDDAVEVDLDEEDLRVDTYRASGAGGQHVNKTDSAVRITHLPPGSSCSAKTSDPRRRTRRRPCGCCGRGCWSSRSESEPRSWRPSAASRRTSAGARRSAATCCIPTQRVKDHRTGPRGGRRPARARRRPRRVRARVPAEERHRRLARPLEAGAAARYVSRVAVRIAVGCSEGFDAVEAFSEAAAGCGPEARCVRAISACCSPALPTWATASGSCRPSTSSSSRAT